MSVYMIIISVFATIQFICSALIIYFAHMSNKHIDNAIKSIDYTLKFLEEENL